MARNLLPLMEDYKPHMAARVKYRCRVAKRKVLSHAGRLALESLVANLDEAIGVRYPDLSTYAAYVRISKAIGLSPSSLHRWSTGETSPQLGNLADVAWHLGTTIEALVRYRPDSPRGGYHLGRPLHAKKS